MAEKNVIDDTVGKLFGKLGITGIATALLMIIFGIVVIVFPDLIAWIIGLYLIIVGLIQLIGYLPALTAKTKKKEPKRQKPKKSEDSEDD